MAMTIGQLARAASIGVETVRYYERMGLIDKPDRHYKGWRRYPDSTLHMLQWVRQARQLGFHVSELAELLGHGGGSDCGRCRAAAEAKLRELDCQIRQLEFQRERLAHLLGSCSQQASSMDCDALKKRIEK